MDRILQSPSFQALQSHLGSAFRQKGVALEICANACVDGAVRLAVHCNATHPGPSSLLISVPISFSFMFKPSVMAKQKLFVPSTAVSRCQTQTSNLRGEALVWPRKRWKLCIVQTFTSTMQLPKWSTLSPFKQATLSALASPNHALSMFSGWRMSLFAKTMQSW